MYNNCMHIEMDCNLKVLYGFTFISKYYLSRQLVNTADKKCNRSIIGFRRLNNLPTL